jgi:hypothetical protein
VDIITSPPSPPEPFRPDENPERFISNQSHLAQARSAQSGDLLFAPFVSKNLATNVLKEYVTDTATIKMLVRHPQ